MICRLSHDAARHELTPVDNRFILDCLPSATGEQVKIYLFGLMQCAHPSLADVALPETLGVSEDAALAAFLYWQHQKLVRIVSDQPLTVEYLPVHEALSESAPPKYASLVSAVNALTAPRQFGMRELRHVYDWIEVYRLDEGAVLELISHCMELRGRQVSVNYISAVAQTWAEKSVCTREDALAYLDDYRRRLHGATAVLRHWNRRRKPTEDEIVLYDKWSKVWGFSEEAILAACPRILAAGTPNFLYLDEQLQLLHEQQKTDAATIVADDRDAAAEKAFAKLLFERAGKVEPATRTQRAQIGMYLNEFQMPRELLLFAAERSRGATEPFGMMKKLLNEWHEAGADTVPAAEEYLQTRPVSAKGKNAAARGYSQKAYTDAELQKLSVNLDEDLL